MNWIVCCIAAILIACLSIGCGLLSLEQKNIDFQSNRLRWGAAMPGAIIETTQSIPLRKDERGIWYYDPYGGNKRSLDGALQAGETLVVEKLVASRFTGHTLECLVLSSSRLGEVQIVMPGPNRDNPSKYSADELRRIGFKIL